MKSLEQIRKEWDSRPIEGASPSEVEKKFPQKEDLYADEKVCIVEGCHRPGFRGESLCKLHHLEKCEARDAEVQRLEKENFKRRSRKDWPEKEARARVLAQTVCANCGDYLIPFGKRTIQLKPKNRRPKKPQQLDRLFEMICKDCAGEK